MNIAGVTQRFMTLSGTDRNECGRWRVLIDDACAYVESRLKVKNPDYAQQQRLEMLCAAYAYRLYCMRGGSGITSFSAGEVKMTSLGGAENAEALWKRLEAESEDLLEQNGFIFGRVM